MKKLFVCIIALFAGIALNVVAGEAGSAAATRDAALVSTMSGQQSVSHGSSVSLSGAKGVSFATVSKGAGAGKGISASHGTKADVSRSSSISESVSAPHAAALPDHPGIVVGAATVTRCVKVEQGASSESVCESRLMTNEDADAVIKAVQAWNGNSAASSIGGASYYSNSMAQSNQVSK